MTTKRYEKNYFTKIVKISSNLTEAAENLGLKPHCGNRNTIKRYIKIYDLDTTHFRVRYEKRKITRKSLDEIMISGSTYNTTDLKHRLYKEGIKERKCEKCGQDENWYGEKMSLILDHINGVSDDHRLVNLRIVCPNCNGTLPTHGGKNRKNTYVSDYAQTNGVCGCGNKKEYNAKCCKQCDELLHRKVERPPYEQLINEIENLGYTGTGRKYGVSDNAIRKWKKFYEKYKE